jgi:hypothetical protein
MLADGRTELQTHVYLPQKCLQNILRILSPKRTYQNKPTNAFIPDNIFGR